MEQMAYPSKFKQLEAERNKPIAEILVEMLNEAGTVAQLARDLQMGYDNVFGKVKECGIYKEPARWMLPEERDHAV